MLSTNEEFELLKIPKLVNKNEHNKNCNLCCKKRIWAKSYNTACESQFYFNRYSELNHSCLRYVQI